jgi:hypothetical protein
VAIAIAFIGAYLALVGRLLSRVNNNDIYPITFHYYSAWLISAVFIAGVFRHITHIANVESNDVIILISFAIGAAPAPFFAALLRQAYKRFDLLGDKNDPEPGQLPSNLNLLMIDGLANEKIDRLAELDITNAKVLSCQNPFVIWPRLPYDLGLIVDWISQAQLYVCLREDGLKAARGQQINDIHKLVAILRDKDALGDVCSLLGLKQTFVEPLVESLERDPCFVRLRAVKEAMVAASSVTRPV